MVALGELVLDGGVQLLEDQRVEPGEGLQVALGDLDLVQGLEEVQGFLSIVEKDRDCLLVVNDV